MRFVKVFTAFHPESDDSKEGDKYNQLRNAITYSNTAASRTFISGIEISFDQCVLPSRLQYNQVR